MPSQRTRQIVGPIIVRTYGSGSMVDALTNHLVEKIDAGDFDSRGREYMIMRVCWDWFSGGGTAENVARKIEEALP